jgi:hypothetical protein
MTYKLEDDPNVACVLRLVSEASYTQAKHKIARMNVPKLFKDLMKDLTEDERTRVETLQTIMCSDYCLGGRRGHVPDKIMAPALLRYVLRLAVELEVTQETR